MSNASPPLYSRLTPFKNTRTTLRPIVMVLTAFGGLWSIAAATSFFKGRSEDNTASATKAFYLIFGILYACAAGLEIYGFAAAWTQRLTLVKNFVYTSLLASIIVTIAEVIRVVAHFSSKFALIGDCARDEGSRLSLAQAQEYCTSKWNNGIYYRIGFLILTALLSFFFATLAASYYHQLTHPQNQRAHEARVAPSAIYNYPLAPYPSNVPAYDSAPPYVPPPGGFSSNDGYKSNVGREGMTSSEEKELEQHRAQLRDEAGWGGTGRTERDARERGFGRSESTETVTLEPRMGNEGRV